MIDGIDHLVLTVRNIGASIVFYTRVLQRQHLTFDHSAKALGFGQQPIKLHAADRPPGDRARNDAYHHLVDDGVAHFVPSFLEAQQ